MTLQQSIKRARQCGVPIIAVGTSDQPACASLVSETINSGAPIVLYDVVRGLTASNKEGQEALAAIMGDLDPSMFSNPSVAIDAATQQAPPKTAIIVLGAQRIITDPTTQQAICNWRDPAKSTTRTLILLAPIGAMQLPPDIATDTMQIDDMPPDADARQAMIAELHRGAGLDQPTELAMQQAVDATRGLSMYAAEQATALSISKAGLDNDQLWARWRQAINNTAGLTVDTSGATLDDVGGLDNLKQFARAVMKGRDKPSAIVRIEEIEKAMAGSSGQALDTSGVSQGILGSLLTYMQEENATGLVAVGPPGSGKSLSSTAIGSAGPVPTITLDLGALKGSLVGQTEANTRAALATIKALAGQNVFFVATCNGVASLPAELKRRFQYGIWFFDLPTAEEREVIWQIWGRKYPEVDISKRPNDDTWTGAEIRTAVQIAYRLNCTPKDAAQWVVPVASIMGDTLTSLRRQASGKYLSASYSGPYHMPDTTQTTTTRPRRAMTIGA